MYIDTPEVKALALRCFPGYSGRTFKVEAFQGPKRLDSNWSGGSRDTFVLLNIGSDKSAHVPENGTPFTMQFKELTELPLNCVLAEHSIFCGKDMGITLYVHPDNLTALLPKPVELSREQRIVLKYTAMLKPSYNGISNYRFHTANRDTGIALEQWESAKAECVAKGLLNKAGAITGNGRNQIASPAQLEKV